MGNVKPIHLKKAAGELFWYDGGLITFKATGVQTAGALLLFEAWMPCGKATPLHAHPESDESFYVMDGEILTYLDGERGSAGSGGIIVIPRGMPHAFAVTSDSARLLVAHTPASAITEAFFRAVGEPASSAMLPLSGKPDLQRMMAAAKETGLTVLGPPPFPPTTSSQAIG